MKDIEADEAECDEIQKQIDEQKQTLDQTRKESETLAVKYQKQIDEIQAEWDQIAKSVPVEKLEIFNRVAETYDGQAVVNVEQQEGEKGAYSCGGCFMGVPAESVNMLMTKDDIIRCPNCTRILVLSDEHGN